MAENSVGLLNQLLSKEEDEIKLELVQKATSKALKALTLFIILIAFAIGIFLAPLIALKEIFGITENVFQGPFLVDLVIISVASVLAFVFPKLKNNESSYSELSQLLHRLALNNYVLQIKLFQREKRKFGQTPERNEFLIISGLARAGTTSMLNDLMESNAFASLNYSNMPFLLCPNTWKKLYNPQKGENKERSHKDGIYIGLGSNEALEEYFFKAHLKDNYIRNEGLFEHEISEEVHDEYLEYQSVVRNSSDKIYLAKNNNFILRYRSIRKLNKEFKMVIMLREPLLHASSLLEKHVQYAKMQEEDPFVLEYMDWLGHHEFGKGVKPFVLGSNKDISANGSLNSIDHWLKVWVNYYSFVNSLDENGMVLIDYEKYCEDPNSTLKKVLGLVQLEDSLHEKKRFINQRKNIEGYSNELYGKARSIYDTLLSKAS
ncbi:MAG: sulfotransferase family protein [Flavobacteriales bacterium]|nr:sulfotransferase family protein [Flavobacteriales bacterium]